MVKSEPEAYSFAQLCRDKQTAWTGVRNFQARNFLKEMAKGDEVFVYHSVSEKAVVGLATVSVAARPDPTAEPGEKGDWVCVVLKAGKSLPKPVSLAAIKSRPDLKNMLLVRHSRLSVMPLSEQEAGALRTLGGL